jgi:hypothetical protein
VAKVYITNENGAQSEFSELEARELLRQGLISRRARYWKSGMVESRPVAELLKDASSDERESGKSPGIFESVWSKIQEWLRNLRR